MLLNSIKKGARRILILQILIFLHCIEAGTCLEGVQVVMTDRENFPDIPCNVPQMPMYKGFFEREMFKQHLPCLAPFIYRGLERFTGDVALFLRNSMQI